MFVIWFITLQDKFIKLEGPFKEIIFVLPLYVLIAFGCYSLGVIGYNLMTFPECEQEAKSLMKEREKAIADLKSKGITL